MVYTNSHAQYDVAIDGVPFFLGPNPELPLVRGPRDVQRQQIDTTSESGEQSFTSWWYRSQTSFHYGQGEKFFDRSKEGESEVNQYQFYDSAGVDPWIKDNVRLLKDTRRVLFDNNGEAQNWPFDGWGDMEGWAHANLSGVIFVSGAVYDDDDMKNNRLFISVFDDATGGMLPAVEIKYLDGETGEDDGRPIHDVGVSGTNWFCMGDNGVFMGELPRRDKDSGMLDWDATVGTKIFRFPKKWDASSGRIAYVKDRLVIAEGNVVWCTVVYPNVDDLTDDDMLEPDGKPKFLAEFRTQKEIKKAWKPDDVDSDMPKGVDDDGFAGDGVSRVLEVHDDPAWRWNGIAEGPDGIFFGGYSGAVNEIHGFYSQTYAAILEQGNEDDPPKLGHPFVTATLPHGEYQLGLTNYVNEFLVIPTTNGVRVAKIDGGGGLRVGPLSIDRREGGDGLGFDSGYYSYDAICDDRYAYVTGANVGGKWGCYRLDMNLPVDAGLKFAWAKDIASGVDAGEGYVARIAAVGKTGLKALFMRDNGVWAEHDRIWVPSGWLHTSWIRYSTWESKIFAYLRTVMSPRHAGTTTVDWWDEYASGPNGRLVPDPATGVPHDGTPPEYDSKGSDLTPQVAVSYRFTLNNPDINGAGPRLLGYQLKSSPSGVVQRELQLPLLCYRRERLRSGRTVERSTWDRIKALESLQASNRIVLYEDFLKGEKLMVQVGGVQFIQDQPGQSAADMENPGGFLRVTLLEADNDPEV